MKKQIDNYQVVTDKIIECLEKGIIPWSQPWKNGLDGLPFNAASKREYHGMNVFLLWITQMSKSYSSSGWLTFKQAKELGGSVRKGEKSTEVVWWQPWEKMVINEDGEKEKKKGLYLKIFHVFNVEQCDGLPERITNPTVKLPGLGNKLSNEYKNFVSATGAVIKVGGNDACYVPVMDYIKMPKLEQFKSADDYALTELHELTHWTGAKARLDRNLGGRFGAETYAIEELIAEMSAAFLGAHLNVQSKIERHASYVDNWLKILRQDKKAIFTAASQATKAANFLRAFSEEVTKEEIAA